MGGGMGGAMGGGIGGGKHTECNFDICLLYFNFVFSIWFFYIVF
jgi:hypothetical protein